MRQMRSPTRTAKELQATRFSPPRAPHIAVERVRLVDRIAESEARLTLICAPAGFGKTTLMQQLRLRYQSRGVAAIWLQVDRGDNDLGRFLHSLTGAIQVALPQFLPRDIANSHQNPTGSAQGLAADLLERISLSEDTITLFLDDLELITDHDICGFLQRLLTNLGPHHQMVIGSRTSPRLALGRMRAHGLVLELDQTDLRFTPEETLSYLTRQRIRAHGVLQPLQQRTDGWPVALQLAAIALSTKGRRSADWLRRFSGSTDSVAEYLAEEVLDSRPAPQQDFLLRSSVLGAFCADMCDAVLDRKDSDDIILRLLGGNLLLSSLDAEQLWYRYHPLLTDFLYARMQRDAPDETQDLHRRAALWTAEQGLINEAVVHALAAQDQTLAADLLASSAMDMVRSGRVADAARAVEMLPDAEVIRRPDLLQAAAFAAFFAHRYSAATRFIEIIERSSDRSNTNGDDEIDAMRLMLLAWTDRIPEMLETVVAMRAELSRFGAFTAGLASNAGAFCNIALGRYVEAERDLIRARQACEPIHALYVLSYSACFTAQIELILGNITAARITLDGAMNRAIIDDQRYGGAGAVVATHLAEVLYEVNELDACEALVSEYMPIVVETGMPDHLIVLHRIAARLHFRNGRRDAGQGTLAQLMEIGARRGVPRLNAAAWLERAYAALCCNDLDDARRSLALGSDAALWQSFGDFSPHASDIEDPLIAGLRVQLVLGRSDQALSQLQPALLAAEATGRRRRALRLLFLRAQILNNLGRRREASAVFDSAVTRATNSDIVMTLVDDSWTAEPLVNRAPAASDSRVAALLRELALSLPARCSKTQQTSTGDTPGIALRLTTREIQVLRLLWKGRSNKAIARDLFLTENTIETHLRRIYEKLGTRSRTQAAALAREAGAI
jgi:LuxR family transcriptional regulator, maltose regulon positive regulatory protein